MKEFTDARELVGQMGLDLEASAGRISNSFRSSIRRELEKLGDGKDSTVLIKQTSSGTLVTLSVGDWVEKEKKVLIEKRFKDLMDRLGASKTGICSGTVPGNLVTFINQSLV